ncbi:MAG: hypothetical protein ACKVQK_13570 [Burkholderiales bacterium]
MTRAAWPSPEPGDILWCRFPQRARDLAGPKPRPALVMEVIEAEDGVAVRVAYGTSQKLVQLVAGEFAIRKNDHPAAYALAGISYDTKFDLRRAVLLSWNENFFAVPPQPRFGQTPKLGTLHASMIKAVKAALGTARARG